MRVQRKRDLKEKNQNRYKALPAQLRNNQRNRVNDQALNQAIYCF